MTIRTRFSPAPTGYLHLGNARAALFGALFALKNQGVFILRIEDTDATRSGEEYVEALQADLQWLGIHWQEGPGVDGPYGPYWQSQRQAIYADAYRQLEEKALIYPCFCTDQELQLARKLQLSRGQAPRYTGICQRLTKEEIESRIQSGKKPAWRFKVPVGVSIEFDDCVKGVQRFLSDDIGDFIIRRADGTAPFLFCNAIDDATMHVTHVIRGEDHVANTPRQMMLLRALQLPVPQYGHLTLIMGEDGAPLSKRHGSFNLRELRESGFLPEALVNYLARLGHACEAQALLSVHALASHFSLDKLSRSSAKFDISQLMYWQKTAVQALDADSLWRWLGERVLDQVPESERALFAETIKGNINFPEDALQWAKILFHENAPIEADGLLILREAGEQFFVEAELAVDKFGIDLQQVLAEMKQTLGVSGKKLFMPLRIALTGQPHGPELGAIAKLLGQKKLKHRLGRAVQLISERAE